MNTQSRRIEYLRGQLSDSGRDQLCVGPFTVGQLAEIVPTPFYAYSGDFILRQVRRVQGALAPHGELVYSIKANPSLGLCQLIAGLGIGAEVASEGELILALTAGFPADRLMFAGPGKTERELLAAGEAGIGAVNVESPGELERLEQISLMIGKPTRVALRVNPSFASPKAQMHMGGAQQFGMDERSAIEALRNCKDSSAIRMVGLHVYSGTQVGDAASMVAYCQQIGELALRVYGILGRPLEFVDFGGGFAVPYFDNSPEFDLDLFADGFRSLTSGLRGTRGFERTRFLIELGRYLVAESGLYVTRVVDVKDSRGVCFAVTDGGMNHHITATGNFGQLFRKPFPLELVGKQHASSRTGPVTVVGPCCTPLDVLGKDIEFGDVEVGDFVAVYCSGAYGYSASSLAFLSHPTPAEVMVLEGRTHVLREAGPSDQVLTGQRPIEDVWSRRASVMPAATAQA